MSDDGLRFHGLYNLVEVKTTGRVGMYIGGVLAPADKGGDWMEVRFEDGTQWRYRPGELKPAKAPSRIFSTERYAFTKSAPVRWRNVWDSLRRTKFRRWVLGPILSNVVSPEPADNKITLRFKSTSVRKRFMEEMEDPRAKEAVRSAIDREYGPGLTLVLASPQDEEAAAKSSAPASADSPLVRAAMAMGARVVEEEPLGGSEG